jgi:translation initiation factor IF-2
MENKVKIKEIADEFGLKPKEILEFCQTLSIDAKSAISGVSYEDAEKISNFHLYGTLPEGAKPIAKVQEVVVEDKPKKAADTVEYIADNIAKELTTHIIPIADTVASPAIIVDDKFAPKERRGLIIVKKANRAKVAEEKPSATSATTHNAARAYAMEELFNKPKVKKPLSHSAPARKVEGVKLGLLGDRSFGNSDHDDDGLVVMPDLSMQSIALAEDEPVAKVNAQKKPSTANKKPAQHRRPPRLEKLDRKKFVRRDQVEEKVIDQIEIPEEIRVYEFAEKVNRSLGEVIKVLFGLGLMVTKNDFLDNNAIEVLAHEFGVEITIKNALDEFDYVKEYDDAEGDDIEIRAPIVTIMGHVDHGKTTLLDRIRDAKVAHGEAGGITQHIGAYMIERKGHKLTFLDTPGHEAFTHMRARGAQVTDIAIIVVAADDGVMPQTKEAIAHVKDAGVPFLIAVNKVDKPAANPDFVKTQLSEMGITPIDWGGQYDFVHISAKTGEGIDTLLDTILMQAEIMELKATTNKKAKAVIIEASLEKGRGAVATVLVKNGTLRVGDNVVSGSTFGKIRAILDDTGANLKELRPSEPGQILGLDGVPKAGDFLVAVENDKIAREYAHNIKEHLRQRELSKTTKATFEDLHQLITEGKLKQLKVILKADVQGSLEAIKNSLEKIRNEEVKVTIVHSAVGAITESDVELANAGENTVVLGFNVKPNTVIKDKADNYGVEIKTYTVIFELIDDIRTLLGTMLSPVYKEVPVGKAEVRSIFTVGKDVVISGCMVIDGSVTKDAKVRVLRNTQVVYEGKVKSLKRFKDDVREVKNGYECGIVLDDFNEQKENDIIECFKLIAEKAVFAEG